MALIVWSVQVAAEAGVTYRTVAMTGDPVPGVEGATFRDFSHPPVISDAGVAFNGRTSGPSTTGVWADLGQGLDLAMIHGETGPGLPGTISSRTEDVIINDAGQIAARPLITGYGFGVVVRNPDGTFTVPALSNTPAPGVEPSEFHIPGFPDLADNGQVAFEASCTGPYIGGVWATGYANGDALQMIAYEGMGAPGTGAQFKYFLHGPFVGGGTTVFQAVLSDSRHSIWQYDAVGGLQPIVVEGDAAPNGETYGSFDNPRVNERGHVALRSGWNGIIKTTDAGTEVVAWSNDVAPGTDGGEFSRSHKPVLNNHDQVAFSAYLSAYTAPTPYKLYGIWSEGLIDELHLVARQGSPAPGTNDAFGDKMDNTAISDAGYTAFMANLENARYTYGLWAETAPGVLELIALEGAEFEVAPGDVRIISDVQFAATYGSIVDAYAHEHAFNGRGEMVFSLKFTDNTTGVFTATVPEPGTLMMLVGGGLVLLSCWCRRWRRRNSH